MPLQSSIGPAFGEELEKAGADHIAETVQDILKYTSPEHMEKFNASKQIIDNLIHKYGNLLESLPFIFR